jgi:O-glycosyl hydrolase
MHLKQRPRALALLVAVGALPILALAPQATAQTSITVDGTHGGRSFDGIGAISGGGGNTRLLFDYPSAQQSEVLDYLFKPHVGASLQILKVEIGGGADSTDGSESTHEPSRGSIGCNAGYEWWLMEQAKARNPEIKLFALAWTAPGWVGGWYNNNAITYVMDWLSCARSHGLDIDYLGGLNEQGIGNGNWFAQLRSTLDAQGFASIRLVAGDQTAGDWTIADRLVSDSHWASVVDIVGAHYTCHGGDGGDAFTCSTTSNARATGKPLWQSEGGSLDFNSGAPNVIRAIVRGYTDSSVTSYINWPLVASVYPNMPFDTVGLIWAHQPWSGWYSVGATTWVTAHVTQFATPGWTFIDSASGYLGGNEQNGAFVSLKSTSGSDYTTIIETTTATSAQTVSFTITGGLSGGTVHVWRTNLGSSNPADWFVRQADITPTGGKYSLTVQPKSVYSISTLSGQAKGTASSPPMSSLSLPYSDSFSGYPVGASAKYLAQIQGDFQSQPCVAQSGTCIMQMLPQTPSIFFFNPGSGLPWATLGDLGWANYTVSVNVLLEQAGTAYLAGRVNANGGSNHSSSHADNFDGYSLQIDDRGDWALNDNFAGSDPQTLASGTVLAPGLNKWATLSMTFDGSTITASINGSRVASVNNSDHGAGQIGIGILGYQTDQFSNLSITPGAGGGCTPTPITPFVQVNGAAWQQVSSATVAPGSSVNLGPQPLNGGTWSWTGPRGFSSAAREIDNIPLSSGTNTFVATFTNSGGCASTQTFVIKVASSGASVPVDLSGAFNIGSAIVTDGSAFTGGGLDNGGASYSANLLGSSLTIGGVTFNLGPANSTDAVSSTTVALPAGRFSTLRVLAAGVNGNQRSQVFSVRFSDSTSQSFTQSVSDWFTPQSFTGESVAKAMSHRDSSDGTTDNRTFDLYAYSFSLDASKTVSSLTLPNNRNVVVLAVTLASN